MAISGGESGDSKLYVVDSTKIKASRFSKKAQFYTDIYMTSVVLALLILNVYNLVTSKSTHFTFFSGVVIGALCFNLFLIRRSLTRSLKERREMKQNGQEFCNVCKGSGTLNIFTTYKNPATNKVKKSKKMYICGKCNSTGKIDWVQKVIDPRRLP
jgi:hypothetical protein